MITWPSDGIVPARGECYRDRRTGEPAEMLCHVHGVCRVKTARGTEYLRRDEFFARYVHKDIYKPADS